MKYLDYLKCAKKHLDSVGSVLEKYKTCEEELNKNISLMLDVYYICGYIMEGVIIYATLKGYEWDADKDVTILDEKFTSDTGLAYHLSDAKKIWGEDEPLSIEHHDWKSINEFLLKKIPNDLPYIGSSPIDSDVRTLLDNWGTYLRYFTHYSPSPTRPNLNMDILNRTYFVCETIVNNIQKVI